MRALLMENEKIEIYDIFKYIIYILIAIWSISQSNAQQLSLEKEMEYNLLNAQKNSNFQMIKMLQNQKQSLSVMNANESIQRSRIQALIGAKENENFRIQRRMKYITE